MVFIRLRSTLNIKNGIERESKLKPVLIALVFDGALCEEIRYSRLIFSFLSLSYKIAYSDEFFWGKIEIRHQCSRKNPYTIEYDFTTNR